MTWRQESVEEEAGILCRSGGVDCDYNLGGEEEEFKQASFASGRV